MKKSLLFCLSALQLAVTGCRKDEENASAGGSNPADTARPQNNALSFTVDGVSFQMVKVEGGTFQMGATSEQSGSAYDDEKPAHDVTLSDYFIGETEVTQALWQPCADQSPGSRTGRLPHVPWRLLVLRREVLPCVVP